MMIVLFALVGLWLVLSMGPGGGQRFGGGKPGPGGPPQGGIGVVIQSRAVHDELKLTDEQVAALRRIAQEVRGKFSERLQKGSPDAMREVAQTLFAELATQWMPQQVQRLKQIVWQARGFSAFADPEVRTALKLTEAEQDRLKSQADEAREDVKQTIQNARASGDVRTQIGPLRRQAIEKAVASLGKDRLQAWKDLIGPPFDVPMDGGGPMGGAPRGPGGPGGQGAFALDYDDD